MAKNISILEGRKARNFSQAKKLRTNLIGGGIQNWIPEDEAGDYCDFRTLEVTENGTYTPSDCDGYDEIIVDVKNGAGDFIPKTITRNGTYNPASDGAAGYSSVTVNVGGGGEYTLKYIPNQISIPLPSGDVVKSIVVVGNDVYICVDKATRSVIYKQTGGVGSFSEIAQTSARMSLLAEMNGELYLLDGGPSNVSYAVLEKWNGSTFETISESFPNNAHPIGGFGSYLMYSLNGSLYVIGANYEVDERKIWKFNGVNFEDMGELLPSAVETNNWPTEGAIYNSKLHILCTGNTDNHYSFDGYSVVKEIDDDYYGSEGANLVIEINGVERLFNGYRSFNGKFWRPEATPPDDGKGGLWTVNNKIFCLGYEVKVVTGGSDS